MCCGASCSERGTIPTVDSTFPVTGKREKGYAASQVDEFFDRARTEYDAPQPALTSVDIRQAGFDLVRGGYDPRPVDAALERLEQAFAQRERSVALATAGPDAWRAQAKRQARVIVDRLQRPEGKRFRRTGLFSTGYRRHDVDEFSQRIIDVFCVGTPLTADEVRDVTFGRERHGYDEAQVDAVLDRTIEILLAIS